MQSELGPSAKDSLELSAFSIMHLPNRTDLSYAEKLLLSYN